LRIDLRNSWAGKTEVSGELCSGGHYSVPGTGEIDESLSSSTAEIGADAWANIGAVKELGPIPQFKTTAKLSEFLKARFLQSF